jgi:hypothetical protein
MTTMFTTAQEAQEATLEAWETILRGYARRGEEYGEYTPSLQIAIKAYLDRVYFPDTALPAIAIYQGHILCYTRRGHITLLRAPTKRTP